MEVLKKVLIVKMSDVEVMWVYNAINRLLKYNWHLNPTNNDIAIYLRL